MALSTLTVTRIQGDTYPVVFNIRRGNAPFDLTGSTVALKVSPNLPPKAGDTVESMNATALNVSQATFAVTSNIANLTPGDYYAEVEITDTDAYVWTPIQFLWRVKPQIS